MGGIPADGNAGRASANVGVIDEPVELADFAISIRCQWHRIVAHLCSTQAVRGRDHWRSDLWRGTQGDFMIALPDRRWPTPWHAGFCKQLHQVCRPEFEHFTAHVSCLVRRAGLAPGARVDPET